MSIISDGNDIYPNCQYICPPPKIQVQYTVGCHPERSAAKDDINLQFLIFNFMPRPTNLKTTIFLDSGFPEETQKFINLLGFLDGQTTNPSLVAKKLKSEEGSIKLSETELYEAYKNIIQEISPLVPDSVSIEVYGDKNTSAEAMIAQGREMNTWIKNAHIKLPTTTEGLKAAEVLSKEGIRINMTLVFSEEQAAAVHAATIGAPKGSVYLSPFIGRLDDRGENGMDLIKNIVKMYNESKSHVEVLTASVRSLEHHLAAIAVGSHRITSPGEILALWAEQGLQIPDASYKYERPELKPMIYQEIDVTKHYSEYNIQHDLTDTGLQKFANDWNGLIGE